VALQDHCSYKAPTTNHHIKQTSSYSNVMFSLNVEQTSQSVITCK